ncbi:MAG: AAA family ATPase [Planctomycetota bacterium]|nr:AAA family ATPase [Planctomycetota bacterium]
MNRETKGPDVEARAAAFAETYARVRAEIGKVIVGNDAVVEGVLVALFAGGHALLEGLPGLGKTKLVHAVAEALDLEFRRIQFTPDLMPADIVGTTILNEDESGRRSFQFQPGPVFGNVVLTDEINRATPKTQSALLEAMQEGRVTVAGTTHPLPRPFFVLATQNPIELEGTYPLPEAQLDRFLLKLLVPSGDLASLVAILERTTGEAEARPEKAAARAELLELRELVRRVPVAKPVVEYAARLVLATHPDSKDAPEPVRSYVRFGASPRGAQALLLCAKVLALSKRRFHVALEDVRAMAKPALRHRLILNFDGEAAGVQADQVLDRALEQVQA